jgi:TP901 family phage tail tape measure protein
MSERVVKVTLSARIDEYKRGMADAASATRAVGTEGEKLAQTREAMNRIGATGVAVGGAIGVGLGVAISKFADFQQAMSYVAATGADAKANIDDLRDAAVEAGAKTVFSATESANAIEEMAKAGVDAKDILGGGLSGALDLAAAGGLGVADAAGIAATALQVFKLNGSDMSHVADLLAAGAGKAMGDVQDLSMALAQGGQVAAATGLTIEETTAGLAAFASQGLLGSDAGTSFKTMLQRLTPQSAEARAKMDELGISAYDANGQFIGLAKFAGNLQGAMKDLTPEARNAAMSVIFGSDAVRAANVLYQEGAEGIEEWTSKVDDQGYAAEVAATRLDNMRGDIEQLSGAVDTAFITIGSAADGPGRFFLQMLTGMVDMFNQMPVGGQQAVLWIGLAAAAAAAGGGAFLLAVPKVVEYRIALETLGPAAQRTARLVGTAFKLMGAAAAGVAIIQVVSQIVDALDGANASAAELSAAFSATNRSADSMWATVGKGRTELGLTAANLRDIQATVDHLNGGDYNYFAFFTASDGVRLTADRLVEVGKNLGTLAGTDLPAAVAGFQKFAAKTDGSEKSLWSLIQIMPDFKSALIAAATEQGLYSESMGDAEKKAILLKLAQDRTTATTKDNEKALAALSGQAQDTGDDVDDLAERIRGFGSAQFDVREAARKFEDALDSLQESIESNGYNLDITTSAGRENEAALDDLAKSALDLAGSLYVTTGSQDQAAAAIQNGRDQLINALAQFGITGQAAEDYANKLGLIPGNIPTVVSLQADEAKQTLDDVLTRIGLIPRTVPVTIEMIQQAGYPISPQAAASLLGPNANGGIYDYSQAMKAKAFADGGFPTGIYAGGPPIHKFAEPETIWEAYISGKPSQRDRNIEIWANAGQRLGVMAGSSGGSQVTNQITVVAAPGMDEDALTRKVIRKIEGKLK